MHSGITKIYYKETAGHVFTKPVQIEGTTKKIFSHKLFFFVVHISAASWWECMYQENDRSRGEVILCIRISHKSVVTVQCAFHAKYAKDPPTDKAIHVWYKQFTETGCLCKQKSSGRPLTAEDDDERVRASFIVHGAHIQHL